MSFLIFALIVVFMYFSIASFISAKKANKHADKIKNKIEYTELIGTTKNVKLYRIHCVGGETETADVGSGSDADLIYQRFVKTANDFITSEKKESTQKSTADELAKLSELHKIGILTDEEFMNAKRKLLK